jgi:lipopolysaccharide export system protein LptA
VDAPLIQFEQKQKRLLAHGEGQGAPMAVHAVLVSAGSSAKAGAKADGAKQGAAIGKTALGGKADVVRVASRELVYSDAAKKAEFTGGVDVESRDGSMKGQQLVVYLQPAQPGAAGKLSSPNDGKGEGGKAASVAGGSGFMGGSVERIVATGHIEMEQPGRRATGEQVVYTASDGMYLLTGTPAALPKVIDDQRGTVTGTSLRFHGGDDNVVVSNGGESGAGQRVRTETRVKNRQ